MPKMKSNSGAKKRFRVTGTGRIKHAKAFKNHILTKKSTKRKRRLRRGGLIDKNQEHLIRLMLPYGK